MYLTIKETAAHLSMSESQLKALIQHKRIRTIHDGEQLLINQDQFSTYFEQLEKYKQLLQDYLDEPIPEDIDVKDED